jgi:hypothetical protein
MSYDNAEAGALAVFVRSGDTWTLQQKITEAGTQRLGKRPSLSKDGNTLVCTAPKSNEAFVWERTGTTWAAPFALHELDSDTRNTPGGWWGNSYAGHGVVSGDGDTIVLGNGHTHGQKGSFSFFERQSTGVGASAWALTDTLAGTIYDEIEQHNAGNQNQDNDDDYYETNSMAISSDGSLLVSGQYRHHYEDRGRVQLFAKDADTRTWSFQSTIGEGPHIHHYTGSTVAMSADGSVIAYGATGGGVSRAGEVNVVTATCA